MDVWEKLSEAQKRSVIAAVVNTALDDEDEDKETRNYKRKKIGSTKTW